MKIDQDENKSKSARVAENIENIYSNFEILMASTTDDDDLLRKTKPFYKYYEPIMNSMLGELSNKGPGSRKEDFADYAIYSHWAMRKL